MTTLDFRKTGWGHAIYVSEQEKGVFEGMLIVTPGPWVGDTILWGTAYGHAEARVEKVKQKLDPQDLYDVTLRIVKRVADESIVSQEDIDTFFEER